MSNPIVFIYPWVNLCEYQVLSVHHQLLYGQYSRWLLRFSLRWSLPSPTIHREWWKTIYIWFNGCKAKYFKQYLKGHGNETDGHGSLAQLLKPLRWWLQICSDIHHGKSTPRYQRYGDPSTLRIRYGKSPDPRITDTGSYLLIFFVENSLYLWYDE